MLILVGFNDIGCDIRDFGVKMGEMLDFTGFDGICDWRVGLLSGCVDESTNGIPGKIDPFLSFLYPHHTYKIIAKNDDFLWFCGFLTNFFSRILWNQARRQQQVE